MIGGSERQGRYGNGQRAHSGTKCQSSVLLAIAICGFGLVLNGDRLLLIRLDPFRKGLTLFRGFDLEVLFSAACLTLFESIEGCSSFIIIDFDLGLECSLHLLETVKTSIREPAPLCNDHTLAGSD